MKAGKAATLREAAEEAVGFLESGPVKLTTLHTRHNDAIARQDFEEAIEWRDKIKRETDRWSPQAVAQRLRAALAHPEPAAPPSDGLLLAEAALDLVKKVVAFDKAGVWMQDNGEAQAFSAMWDAAEKLEPMAREAIAAAEARQAAAPQVKP